MLRRQISVARVRCASYGGPARGFGGPSHAGRAMEFDLGNGRQSTNACGRSDCFRAWPAGSAS